MYPLLLFVLAVWIVICRLCFVRNRDDEFPTDETEAAISRVNNEIKEIEPTEQNSNNGQIVENTERERPEVNVDSNTQRRRTQYALKWVVTIFSGMIYGYITAVLDGLASVNDFMASEFPSLYKKKTHTYEDNYCKFSSILLAAIFSSILLAVFVIRVPTLGLCHRFRLRSIFLSSWLAVFVGVVLVLIITNGVGLILGSITMGCGLGVSSLVVQIYMHETSTGNTRSTLDLLFYSSIGIGISLANVLNYVIVYQHTQLGWKLYFIVAGALVGFISFKSWYLDNLGPIDPTHQRFRELLQIRHIPPLSISLASQGFGALLGTVSLLFSMPAFYVKMGVHEKTALIYSVITLTVSFGGMFASSILFPRLGRRISLFLGSAVMLIFQAIVAAMVHFYMGADVEPSRAHAIYLVLCVCVHSLAYNTCFGPLGWLSATFPREIVWVGFIFTVSTGVVLTVVLSQVIWLVTCPIGTWFIAFFVAADLLQISFVYYFVPETTGVVLGGMEDVWRAHWFWKRFMPVVL